MYPTKPLGEICKKNFSVGKVSKTDYLEEGLLPVIDQGKTFIGGYTNDLGVKYTGDLPVLIYGDHTNSLKFVDFDFTGGADGIKILAFTKGIDTKYMFYCINFYKPDNLGYRRHFPLLKQIKIPLPPLSTQQKIVEKLDAVLEKIEKHIELTKQNLANIEEQNTSILEKIFKECEEEFEMKELGKISENIQYGYTGKTTETGKIKYLRITDIQDNAISWEKVPFVDITEKEIAKYSLNEGDIVFARTGATVGKSCLIDKEGIGNVFASYLIRVIPDKNIINPLFLKYFFLSGTYWKQIFSEVVGSAQPNFNGTKLKSIQIPLPPLSKQQEIVTYLDNIFAKNAELKYLYEKNLKNLEELKQSILKEAFENEDFVQ